MVRNLVTIRVFITVDDFLARLESGDELKSTELTPQYDYAQYLAQNPGNLPVFVVSPDGRVYFPVGDQPFEPGEGWNVGAVVPASRNRGEGQWAKAY